MPVGNRGVEVDEGDGQAMDPPVDVCPYSAYPDEVSVTAMTDSR